MRTETDTPDGEPRIIATEVPEEKRMEFLPTHFPTTYLHYENAVYQFMQKITNGQYTGGFWDYIELSNGGGYMRLASDQSFQCSNPAAYWDGELSADAASIAANLYASSNLSFSTQLGEKAQRNLAQNYENLCDFKHQHLECVAIHQACD